MSNAESGALPAAADDDERLLADVRSIIASGRVRAATAGGAEMVATYWRIGQRIVQEEQHGERRAAYGERLWGAPGPHARRRSRAGLYPASAKTDAPVFCDRPECARGADAIGLDTLSHADAPAPGSARLL